jgi:hypothetical protein
MRRFPTAISSTFFPLSETFVESREGGIFTRMTTKICDFLFLCLFHANDEHHCQTEIIILKNLLLYKILCPGNKEQGGRCIFSHFNFFAYNLKVN